MKFEINSRKLKQTVTFSKPGSSYIYIDLSEYQNKPGTLGRQICDGGNLIGSTISYHGNDESVFERICRRWWRAYSRDCITDPKIDFDSYTNFIQS